MRLSTAAVVSSLLLGQAAADLPPIIKKGSKFFYENGTQFFMKGIAYQQDTAAAGATTSSKKYIDPLADATKCARDVPNLVKLKTNVIRTYAIDPTADHSACMQLLQNAGIYVISDLSEPATSINRDDPVWDTTVYQRYMDVADEMGKYSNVIGFFAGNEVTNNASNTRASAYVKAAVRDTKKHLKQKYQRWIGVGYAANDDADIRANMANYFNCGPNEESIDFWGYNIYEWCGQNTFQGSGYATQVQFFSNFSVPVFFAEYGCNTQGGADARIWQETTALYSSDMTGVISGGIVYMYFQEANDYGLVKEVGSSVSIMDNFKRLSTVIASATPASTSANAYNPPTAAAACPAIDVNWRASASLPPTPDKDLCDCMFNSLSCKPKATLDPKDYGKLFGQVCGLNNGAACAGIKTDEGAGVYGVYSMCSPMQKLGHVLDAYYRSQKSSKSACDWAGQALVASSPAAAASCSASLQSAASANAVAATATSAPQSSGTKNAAAGSVYGGPRAFFGKFDVLVGAVVLAAMSAGAGFVLL